MADDSLPNLYEEKKIMSSSSSWVDLLSAQSNLTAFDSVPRKKGVVVTECTPASNGKVFSRRRNMSEVDILKDQVTLLLNENRELKRSLDQVDG